MITTLTGQKDSKMVEDVIQALDRFNDLEIKVTIEVFTGKKPKAQPPNTHVAKNALGAAGETNSGEAL